LSADGDRGVRRELDLPPGIRRAALLAENDTVFDTGSMENDFDLAKVRTQRRGPVRPASKLILSWIETGWRRAAVSWQAVRTEKEAGESSRPPRAARRHQRLVLGGRS
jgi:hypothetical protein